MHGFLSGFKSERALLGGLKGIVWWVTDKNNYWWLGEFGVTKKEKKS